jgi:hypothetical protein
VNKAIKHDDKRADRRAAFKAISINFGSLIIFLYLSIKKEIKMKQKKEFYSFLSCFRCRILPRIQ